MLKNWQFWFAIIGALITGLIMFDNLRTELAVQSNEIQHIKSDVSEIKSILQPSPVVGEMLSTSDKI